MRLFERAKSQTALASFLALGEPETNTAQGATLDYGHWSRLLDALEAARKEVQGGSMAATIVPADKVAALRHYHRVYDVAARLLPLPAPRWAQWREGLHDFWADAEQDDVLRQCRATLLAAQWEAQEAAFWGSSTGLAATVAALAQRVSCAAPDAADSEEGDTVAHFVRQHQSLLHEFNRVCHLAQHLYADYAAIGALQRAWLGELLARDDAAIVESVVRGTFRRDFSVPSSALGGALRDEYDDFEVDEAKRAAMGQLETSTLESSWYAAADALHRHECRAATAHDGANGMETWDAEANALADALARAMSSDLAVLGLTMQRVLEKEPFPAVVNPARLDYALVTLQRWLEKYLTHSAHRWSGEAAFCAPDDADLWRFVLQRHLVLLRWALHDVVRAEDGRWQRAVHVLRTVAFATLHCTHMYVATTSQSRASAEKSRERVRGVWAATVRCVREELVDRVACALDADLARAHAGTAHAVTLHALQSELQIVLHQVLGMCVDQHAVLASAVDAVGQRVGVLVRAGLAMLESDTPALRGEVRGGVVRTVLRLLEQHGCDASQASVSTMLESYATLARCVDAGTADAAALVARVDDGWVRCISVRAADVPCSAAYLRPRTQRRGRLLMDSCCERRKALKRVRDAASDEPTCDPDR